MAQPSPHLCRRCYIVFKLNCLHCQHCHCLYFFYVKANAFQMPQHLQPRNKRRLSSRFCPMLRIRTGNWTACCIKFLTTAFSCEPSAEAPRLGPKKAVYSDVTSSSKMSKPSKCVEAAKGAAKAAPTATPTGGPPGGSQARLCCCCKTVSSSHRTYS